VNVDKLISFRAIDDDFDFTEGVQCVINNCLAIRSSFISSPEGSRSLEIESYESAVDADLSKKPTYVEANYMTFINDNNEVQSVTNEAVFIKERSILSLKNSIITGYRIGIVFDDQIKGNAVNFESFKFENILLNNCTEGNFTSENNAYTTFIAQYYKREELFIESNDVEATALFIDADLKKTPDLRFKSAMILASKDVAKKN
jgi:hypothetical protein